VNMSEVHESLWLESKSAIRMAEAVSKWSVGTEEGRTLYQSR